MFVALSKLFGVVYPFVTLVPVTIPLGFTRVGESPKYPSPSESVYPASVTSLHPSPSASNSRKSAMPSGTVSESDTV